MIYKTITNTGWPSTLFLTRAKAFVLGKLVGRPRKMSKDSANLVKCNDINIQGKEPTEFLFIFNMH